MFRSLCGSAVLVVGVHFGVAIPALASPPIGQPPKDAKEAYAQAAVVFVGRIERVSADKLGFLSQAEGRVERSWKGGELLRKVVRVDGAGGPTHPARVFDKGKRYLFYLPAPAGQGSGKDTFHADSFIHRVLALEKAENEAQKTQLKQAEDDLQYLSQLKSQELK